MEFAVFVASAMTVLITSFLNKRRDGTQTSIFAEIFDRTRQSLSARRQLGSSPAQLTPEEAQLRSKYKSLNIFLYIGSFIFISALTAYLSSISREIVPPTVISVTLLTAMASLLIFKYVNFLKPAAFAFNISALIMFIFWWASLEALNFSAINSNLIIFSSITIVSLVSAIVFNDSKYWHCVFAFFGFLIVAIINFFAGFDSITATSYSLIALSIIFSILSSILICLWKGHAKFVPMAMRQSVKNFAFIYQIVPLFFIPVFFIESHFSATISIAFLLFNYLLSKLVSGEKASIPIIRAILQFAAIILAIDICASIDTNADYTNHISLVALISSLIQSIISCILLVTKKNEHDRALERSIICFAVVFSSFVCYKYFSALTGFDNTLGAIALALCGLICIAMFLVDKSSLWLSPAVLFAASFLNFGSNDTDLLPVALVAFTVLCFLAPFIYYTGHRKDEQEAILGAAGLLSAVSLANIIIQAKSNALSGLALIPTGAGLVSLVILTAITNSTSILKICFYYMAILLLHAAICFEPDNYFGLSFLAIEAIPIAMLAHGGLNSTLNKESSPNALIITAYTLFELIYLPNMVDASYIKSNVSVVALVGVLVNLGLLILASIRKWKVLQGFTIGTIILQLLAVTGNNTALWFIILGLVIIVGVIIGFYRLANKEQNPGQNPDQGQNLSQN